MSATSTILIIIGFANLIFGLGLGIPLTYWVVNRSRKRKKALQRVEETEGEVITSGVQRVRNTSSQGPKYLYKPVIRFVYEYDGQKYQSNRRAYEMLFGETSESKANSTAQKYPEGEVVSVHVDPKNPSKGFLEIDETRQSMSTGFLLIIGVFLIFFGIAGAVLLSASLFVF